MNDTIDRVDEWRRAAREIRALNRAARRGKRTKASRKARFRINAMRWWP